MNSRMNWYFISFRKDNSPTIIPTKPEPETPLAIPLTLDLETSNQFNFERSIIPHGTGANHGGAVDKLAMRDYYVFKMWLMSLENNMLHGSINCLETRNRQNRQILQQNSHALEEKKSIEFLNKNTTSSYELDHSTV